MSKHYNTNIDALKLIQREYRKGISETIASLSVSEDKPGTFGEMQRRLQNNSIFLQNEREDTLKRIDEYKEVYHPDRIAKNKQEAINQYAELGAKMTAKAKEEVIALCETKAEQIKAMVTKEPTSEQLRLLDVLEKRRGNVSQLEFTSIMSSMYGNYQALMALSAIAGDSGVTLSVPAQYDVPTLYMALEEAKNYLLSACNELAKSKQDRDIRYSAFYTTGGDGENANHYDPHYREFVAIFDTIPQLQDITVTKTALTPTEQVKMDYYFAEVKALKGDETATETEVLKAVKAVMDAHSGDVELMKLTPYKEDIETVEAALEDAEGENKTA